ncbi:MAG: hypothetical protein IH945_08985 [Armatimonadetes bacterium]|nr:hypothetical protein [Armatimonadota bacterium]
MNSFWTTGSLIGAGAATFVASVGVLGCLKGADQGQDPARFSKSEDMRAYALPYDQAYIIYGGTPVQASVQAVNRPGEVDFSFEAHDEVLDMELYSYDDKTFRYRGSSTETYTPGILLLRFPLEVGDSWTWAGTFRWGDRERPAKAKISTASERLNTLAGEFGTVAVTVEVEVETGGKEPATYELLFWFAPERGLVRREFAHGTTREPMASTNAARQ